MSTKQGTKKKGKPIDNGKKGTESHRKSGGPGKGAAPQHPSPKKTKKKSGSAATKQRKERRTAPRTQVPHPGDDCSPGLFSRFLSILLGRKPPKDLDVCLGAEAPQRKPSLMQRLLGPSKAKPAKKKEQEHDPFGFSLNDQPQHNDPVHQAIAVSLPGLAAGVSELKRALLVHDISTTGIGLKYDGPRVKAGTTLTMLLATKQQRLLTGLRAEVKRHEKGVLGAVFLEPDRHQETVLSKLVLEGQKRAKARKSKRQLPPEIQNMKLK